MYPCFPPLSFFLCFFRASPDAENVSASVLARPMPNSFFCTHSFTPLINSCKYNMIDHVPRLIPKSPVFFVPFTHHWISRNCSYWRRCNVGVTPVPIEFEFEFEDIRISKQNFVAPAMGDWEINRHFLKLDIPDKILLIVYRARKDQNSLTLERAHRIVARRDRAKEYHHFHREV